MTGPEAKALSGTERAVLGLEQPDAVADLFNRYAARALGSAVRTVRFRSGRIDVVWGVELEDARAVALRAYRQPLALEPVRANREAQRMLARGGFPCPEPLSGPDPVEGHLLAAETLVAAGVMPDGCNPYHRGLLAAGLARHVELLRGRTDLHARIGSGPSWCRYHDGPWPTPHDPIVDFTSTPSAYAWLDSLAGRAVEQILRHRGSERVLGHADWYAGNTAVSGSGTDATLVASFDWELVADAEAVIAGFAAACFGASPTGSGGLSTPADAVAFLMDYDAARGAKSDPHAQRAAAGAVTWILAFNARWQVGLIERGLADPTVIELVRREGEHCLDLAW